MGLIVGVGKKRLLTAKFMTDQTPPVEAVIDGEPDWMSSDNSVFALAVQIDTKQAYAVRVGDGMGVMITCSGDADLDLTGKRMVTGMIELDAPAPVVEAGHVTIDAGDEVDA